LTLEIARNDGGQDGKYHSSGKDRGGSLSHISNAPLSDLLVVVSGKAGHVLKQGMRTAAFDHRT